MPGLSRSKQLHYRCSLKAAMWSLTRFPRRGSCDSEVLSGERLNPSKPNTVEAQRIADTLVLDA